MREAFFYIFVSVQLLIPIWQLLASSEAQPYGWQMYARLKERPKYLLINQNGQKIELELEDILPWHRMELDYRRQILPLICKQHPEARLARYITKDGHAVTQHCFSRLFLKSFSRQVTP